MVLNYRIENATNRANTNLKTPSIEKAIVDGVHSVFPNTTAIVFPDYFSIDVPSTTTDKELREMGHEVVYGSPLLINIIKKYNYTRRSNGSSATSNQVFRRF
jgi:hypothetical protein